MNVNLSNLKNLSGLRNTKLSDISRAWKITGLVALGIGALAYPAFRLYKYIMQRRQKDTLKEDGNGMSKTFSPAYRGHHKPHHRKVETNSGNLNEGLA